MKEITVKILRGAETGSGVYQTYIVPVEEDTAISVMNLLEEIYNKQDGRYINEMGAFWFHKERNPFDAQWHTYLLVKQGGKWSIQNGGSGGKGYWQRDGNRLSNKGTGEFIFEIEKVK